mgnify:CR=1 FL=1
MTLNMTLKVILQNILLMLIILSKYHFLKNVNGIKKIQVLVNWKHLVMFR